MKKNALSMKKIEIENISYIAHFHFSCLLLRKTYSKIGVLYVFGCADCEFERILAIGCGEVPYFCNAYVKCLKFSSQVYANCTKIS